jgi:hypothetical protein
MSITRLVDLDRFNDPESLTDLFETDALLDALGDRETSYAELLDRPGQSGQPDRALFLLRALTESLDASLADLLDAADLDELDEQRELDELGVAFDRADTAGPADAADSASPARLLQFVPRESAPLSCAAEPVASGQGSAFLRVAGRAVPRHLPRANRFVAAAAGAMIVLSGGGLAAAATTAPGHGWGPLAPLSRVLHPGWTDDGLAAKRAVVMRELEQAVQQSRSGQKVAAAATYGVATRRAHDLPKGPDPTLQARIAAVAQQLGLTVDPTTIVPPVVTATPVAVDPTDPLGGTLPTTPVAPDPGSVAPPTSGAAPGTLPPAPPADPSAPSGAEPGGSTAPTDPTAPTTPTDPTAPVTQPTDPGTTTPPIVGGGTPTGSQPAGPSDPAGGTAAPSDPAGGTTATPPVTDPTAPPVTQPTDPGQPHRHPGRHRAHRGHHRAPQPGGSGTPVATPPGGTASDPAPSDPPATATSSPPVIDPPAAPTTDASASAAGSADVTADTTQG